MKTVCLHCGTYCETSAVPFKEHPCQDKNHTKRMYKQQKKIPVYMEKVKPVTNNTGGETA